MIEQLDPIYCRTDKPALLKPILSYKKEFWRKEDYRKVRQEYPAYLISKGGLFLAGFIPRVEKETGQEISNKIIYDLVEMPNLPGITFREDQIDLISKALKYGRGVIKSPTGSGKTILASGIISCFSLEKKILFLCHTISLLTQTRDEFLRFLPYHSISTIGDGIKNLDGNIVISTIQSFSKLAVEDYCDLFDVVIVDECHHSCKEGSLYYKVLTTLLAPVRIGLTATLPVSYGDRLVLEGLLGPIIGEVTLKEGEEKNLLAKIKVKLLSVPYCNDLRDMKLYKDIREAGICSYRTRNRMIIDEIRKLNSEGKSTLTYVTKIEHGEKLLKIADNLDVETILIQGSTEGEVRNQLRKDLQEKKLLNVIATVVWKEGVNVPSINCIILADVGKSELSLIQTIGRGLRKDIGKEEILIIDFVDSGKYLSEHFCERLKVYINNGWI